MFANFCSPCHGEGGDGKGVLAEGLPLKPRNFREGTLRWGNSRRSVVETILGGRSEVMPSFRGAIPDEDVEAVASFVWSLLPASSRASSPPPHGVSESSNGKTHVVGQKNKRFRPDRIVIAPGDTLLLVNDDVVDHDVHPTARGGKSEALRTQRPGHWDRVAFSEKGTFEYRCSFHPNMKLIVEVK